MCGIFAAFNCPQAAEITFYGLHALQHRAKEYAGMATSDGVNIFRRADRGLVQEVFPDQAALDWLHGRDALGHLRYSTTEDDPTLDNTQPVMMPFNGREVALAHNGNLVNHQRLRQAWAVHGPYKTSMDTEVILRLFCLSRAEDIAQRVFDAVRPLRGSFSLVFMFDDVMIAVRDPWGNRPLVLGRRDQSWFLSSESVAFDNIGIETVREIEPGEILLITKDGLRSWYFDEERLAEQPLPHQQAKCIFEQIYYSHPASKVFGQDLVEWRRCCGAELCRRCPSSATTVVSVPASAIFHAEGYAGEQTGGHDTRGLLRSHYTGRTFIEPRQEMRIEAVSRKFTALAFLLKGKAVTLIDDSIVRLTTLPGVVNLIRRAGASEVHARIAAPPIKHPCQYGIDTPSYQELAAANFSLDEIKKRAGLDSLEYMPMEGLRSLVADPENYCFACMTGEYPIKDE